MTAEQFVIWLDGLLTGNHGAQPSEKQWAAIVSRMEEVMKPRNEKVSPSVMMRTKPLTSEEIDRMIIGGVANAQQYEDITTTIEKYGRNYQFDPKEIGLSARDLIKDRNQNSFNGPVVIPGVSQ